jgi:hypothetical protein
LGEGGRTRLKEESARRLGFLSIDTNAITLIPALLPLREKGS